MATVTTSIYALTGGVKIAFVAPSANSDVITKYKIEIQKLDLSFAEDTTNCDGSNAAIIS